MHQTIQLTLNENIVPFLTPVNKPLSVLVVEDDRMQRVFLEECLRDLGHEFIEAGNGAEALDILLAQGDKIDIVLMDRIMPLMDGITAVIRMKDHPALRKIPVIMVTGAASAHEIQEGIEAGVFYYLAKPVTPDMLGSVLTAAAREVEQMRGLTVEMRRHRASFSLIDSCKFRLRTLDEAECLTAFAAHCFPDPERVLQGLSELLINAVEHGNLEIGYDRKTELIADGTWRAEIERRLSMPAYQNRHAEVTVARRDDGVYLVVTDQGGGFNWQRYMSIDPTRAADNHGRGIAQANALSFDRLTYNAAGNQAVAFVGHKKRLEW